VIPFDREGDMARSPKPPGIEKLLSSNPLILLAGVAVTVGTVVAGVVTYLGTEKLEALDIRHQTEISQVKDKAAIDIIEATRPLKEKLEDLNFRVSSIERRVPGSGPSYLDISTVTIGEEARNSLSPRYTAFNNDGFFVAVPNGDGWQFSVSNELDYLKGIYSVMDKIVSEMPQLAETSKATVFIWQNVNQAVKIYKKVFDFDDATFTYHPSVLIMPINQKLLNDHVRMIKEALDSVDSDVENDKKAAAELGAAIDNLKQQSNDKPQESGTEAVIKKVEAKDSVVSILEKLGSSDVSNFEFFDQVSQLVIQNQAWPMRHKVLSSQKKGNVFYIQDEILFQDVDVEINASSKHHTDALSISQEIFFFSRGPDGYLVKMILPPVPDRASNFVWSKSWLTGLQIPID
jgi:hypothetical protein